MLDEIEKTANIVDFYTSDSSPYWGYNKELRKGGSFDVDMLLVEQDNVETTDPPYDQLIVLTTLRHEFGNIKLDYGDGWVEHPLPPQHGILHLHPPNTECHFDIVGPHTILVAAIPWAPLVAKLDEVGIRFDPFGSYYNDFKQMQAGYDTLLQLWQVVQSEDPADALLVDALVISLLSELLRGDDVAVSPPPNLDDQRLQRIVDYIEANLASQILMSELAGIAALSITHMPRLFRKATGLTPHGYLTWRRIEQAKFLLATTEDAVTIVAFACGFGSSAHFATVFKSQVGVSPSVYRSATR